MTCQECGQRPATVFFKADVNGQAMELSLCESCASDRGIMDPLGGPAGLGPLGLDVGSLLGSLAHGLHEHWAKSLQAAAKPAQFKCPRCETSFASFKSSGYVGCAQCYETFQAAMREILKRLHGRSNHTGKTCIHREDKEKPHTKEEISRLKKELERAIQQEAFEQAAALRDRIRTLESEK